MKNIFVAILITLFCTSNPAQDFVVKSLNVYTSESKIDLPVLINDNKLIIEFDIQGEFIPNMNIVFRFCDYDWQPTKNIFLLNPLHSIYYFLDFEELPFNVEDARYHSISSYPDDRGDVEFPFSGKWRFYITDTQDTSIVYAEGKFFVVLDDIEMSVKLKRDQLDDKSYWPVELTKVFNVTTDFYLPNQFHPTFVDRVEIIDNQRVSYPIIVNKKSNSLGRQFKWDANRKFTFIARDIPAGNEFRQVDIRNSNKFIAKDVKAQLDGLENSRFFLTPFNEDLNGGKLYADFRDDYSTYLNVTFSIRPPEDFYQNIFLVGAFNNWVLNPEYKMNEVAGIHAITIPLKRGIYDYQYVGGDLIDGVIENADWLILEGNTWQNKKVFDVFLYYNEQESGGYEKIIGYKRITTR